MARPHLDSRLLMDIGRTAVYRGMWAVLREFHQPVTENYTSDRKPDLSDLSKGIDTVSKTEITDTLHKRLGPTFDIGYYVVDEESGCNYVDRPNSNPPSSEDEELIVFIDPVDFTAAAARGLDGSILVSFFHLDRGILSTIVGDIYRRRIYSASWDCQSYYQEVLFNQDPRFPTTLGTKRKLEMEEVGFGPEVIHLHTSGKENLERLAVNVFLSKPTRLMETIEKGLPLWTSQTMTTSKRGQVIIEPIIQEIYTVGGSLGPVRVADGTWDASLEFVKGFRIWDFAPGAFIASRAGAAVIELETGDEIDFKFDFIRNEIVNENVNLIQRFSDKEYLDKDRKKFIVAATKTLAIRIREILLRKEARLLPSWDALDEQGEVEVLEQLSVIVEVFLPQKTVKQEQMVKLLTAIKEFMNACGLDLEEEGKPSHGSFYQKFKFWTKKPSTHQELLDIYKEGKDALRLKYLNKTTAETTEKLATATKYLIESIQEFDEAVIRMGAILVLKANVDGKSKLLVENVSPQIMDKLENNPHLVKEHLKLYNLVTEDLGSRQIEKSD